MMGDLFRLVDDLGDRHLGARHEGRLMASFAAQVPMGAPREPLERLLHQVARHAELVVVLDERVDAEYGHAPHTYGHEQQRGNTGYRERRKTANPAYDRADHAFDSRHQEFLVSVSPVRISRVRDSPPPYQHAGGHARAAGWIAR
jgi:hypothetical protein